MEWRKKNALKLCDGHRLWVMFCKFGGRRISCVQTHHQNKQGAATSKLFESIKFGVGAFVVLTFPDSLVARLNVDCVRIPFHWVSPWYAIKKCWVCYAVLGSDPATEYTVTFKINPDRHLHLKFEWVQSDIVIKCIIRSYSPVFLHAHRL